MAFICKNGPEHHHDTAQEGRECWARVIGPNASAVPGVTPPPPVTPEAVQPATPYALQHRTSVPLPMLEATPDGYYAVRLDDKDHFRFIRISRRFPKRSRWTGCIQTQTQHSDDLRILLTYRPLESPDSPWPEERIWVMQPHMEKYLILVMVDPIGAGQAYATKLGRCMICGKTLTDPRSIHYGIGPDCEKDHPEVIAYVDGLAAEEDE